MSEPYTTAEMTADVLKWHDANADQMASAFVNLFFAAAAVARSDQNMVLVETIREIRVWVQS